MPAPACDYSSPRRRGGDVSTDPPPLLLDHLDDDLEDLDDVDDDLELHDGLRVRQGPGTHPCRGHVLLPAAAALLMVTIGLVCLAPGFFSTGFMAPLTAGLALPHTPGSSSSSAPTAATTVTDVPTVPEPTAAARTPTTADTGSANSTDFTGTAAAGDLAIPEDLAAAQASPQASPEDLLAGDVDDSVLQQLMQDSLPDWVGHRDAAAAIGPDAQAAADMAWNALSEDLLNGGWTSPQRQVTAVTSTATLPGDGELPMTISVVFMWKAQTSAGDDVDRQVSVVDLNRGAGNWAVDKIRTMP